MAAPPRFAATGGKDYIGWRGMTRTSTPSRTHSAEYVREHRGMRVHAWRGIGAGYNKFAAEVLPRRGGAGGRQRSARDASRTDQGPAARARPSSRRWPRCRTARRSARAAAWASRSPTITTRLSAGVAEVSVDKATGKIKVHNYWIASRPRPGHPARQRPGAARKRGGLWLVRARCRGADGEGRRRPADRTSTTIRCCA